jgi:hypothetical protein
MRSSVGRWGDAERPPERRGERTDAAKADRQADVYDRPIGVSEQSGGALHPPHQQVLVRRLAECAAELATEVRRRKPRSAGEHSHVERLAVARVYQVFRSEEMPRWMSVRHYSGLSDIWRG